jgi:hypothetical protein
MSCAAQAVQIFPHPRNGPAARPEMLSCHCFGRPHRALVRLQDLRDRGLVTEEEYTTKRAEIISRLYGAGWLFRGLRVTPARGAVHPHSY